jgi:hypothetical protein
MATFTTICGSISLYGMRIKGMHMMKNVCGRYAQNVTKTEQSFKTKKQGQVGISHNTAKSQNQKKSKKRLGIYLLLIKPIY